MVTQWHYLKEVKVTLLPKLETDQSDLPLTFFTSCNYILFLGLGFINKILCV